MKAAITMILPLAITRSRADPERVGNSEDVYAWTVASQVVVVVVVCAREGDGLSPHLGTPNAVHLLPSLRVEKVCSRER